MLKKLVEMTIVTVVVAAAAVGQDKAVSGKKARGTTTPAKQSTQAQVETVHESTGNGMAAMRHAAEEGKYLFVFFHKDNGEQTLKLRAVFDAAMQKVADKAESVAVNTTDPQEQEIVDKFKVSRAPMPLVFSVAPNGAIIRSFRMKFSEQQLLSAFASPCLEKSLKALQDRKMLLLCVQNTATKSNGEAMKGVHDFVADPKYARNTEIVTLDPSDAAEAGFLKNLKVDPKTPEAVTLLLAPPGKTVGTFKGATNKSMLVAAATQSKSGCGCKSGSSCGK